MFEVICSDCKRVYDYNFDLVDPRAGSHGLCPRCAFIKLTEMGKTNFIKRFFARRWAAKVYDLSSYNHTENKNFLKKEKIARELSKFDIEIKEPMAFSF